MRYLVMIGLTTLLGSAPLAVATEPALPPLDVGRLFHRMVVVNNRLMLVGGHSGGEPEASTHFDIFDPKKNRWSTKSHPFKTRGPGLYPAVIDKYVYVLDAFGKALQRYDVGDDRWTELSPIPTSRVNGTVVSFQSKIYVIGGYSKDVTAKNSVEVYDPKTETWALGPPLPGYEAGDHFHLASVLHGKLHVVGHYFKGNDHWALKNGEWKKKAPAPVSECGWKMSCLESVGGKLYLLDPSHNRGNEQPNFFSYSPKENQWKPLGHLPKGFPVALFASSTIKEKIYVTGGVNSSHTMFQYDTRTQKWTMSNYK